MTLDEYKQWLDDKIQQHEDWAAVGDDLDNQLSHLSAAHAYRTARFCAEEITE